MGWVVHEAGAAVMCQVTHLGRRSSNYTGDWLPLVYPSSLREPAHRSFPKVAEPWDLDRIVADYAAAAERCVAAGLDGIELQSYGHLFDAFHRSSNLDALSIPGTGLGLAIARRIARLHGGDVRVESELGRGSTFTLVVPVETP